MQNHILEAVERIRQMEAVFDFLLSTSEDDPRYREQLQSLLQYYESPQWRRDYALDEQGLLPEGLKRGVLSEDGVYNFLTALPHNKNTL